MHKKHYKITIAASREAVWNSLWDDDSYRDWSSVFAEGSKAITDWQKGSKVLFLDNKNEGMVSVIEDRKTNEYMSIKHLGVVKNGVEETNTEDSKVWHGYENYTLKDVNGKTDLLIDMQLGDIPKEFIEYFDKTWPKALDKIKELAEKKVEEHHSH
jgi:hypothetical protein